MAYIDPEPSWATPRSASNPSQARPELVARAVDRTWPLGGSRRPQRASHQRLRAAHPSADRASRASTTESTTASAAGHRLRLQAGGIVIRAGADPVYGHQIVVDHGGGLESRYGHMYADGVLVAVGDRVRAGQIVGTVGSDGWSTALRSALHGGQRRPARRPARNRRAGAGVTRGSGSRVGLLVGRLRSRSAVTWV